MENPPSPPIIIFPQPPPNEFFEDLETVRSAGPELLAALRKICAAETKPDLMKAITEGVCLVEKLPAL